MTIYKFGQIVLIGFPHTDLRSVSKRPAMVLYDGRDQDVLVARITTRKYLTEADYEIQKWRKCGLNAPSYIRLGKQATIEKQHILRSLGSLSDSEAESLKAILRKIFEL